MYDLSGTKLHGWTSSSNDLNFGGYAGNKISIINGQLGLLDAKSKQITPYTLAGEVIRHIQCAEITADTCVSMCECVMTTQSSSPATALLKCSSSICYLELWTGVIPISKIHLL